MTAARIPARRSASLVIAILAAVIAVCLGSTGAWAAASDRSDAAPIDEKLAADMKRDPGGVFAVLVHAEDIEAARAAVAATGMHKGGEFRKVGIVSATATASQIQASRTEPGVTYLQSGEQDIEYKGSPGDLESSGEQGNELRGSPGDL